MEHLKHNEKDFSFENEKEEADWEVYNSTISYWANVATLRERHLATEIDYFRDTPEKSKLFAKNLNYMSIDCTPATHVDQVIRATVQDHDSRNP